MTFRHPVLRYIVDFGSPIRAAISIAGICALRKSFRIFGTALWGIGSARDSLPTFIGRALEFHAPGNGLIAKRNAPDTENAIRAAYSADARRSGPRDGAFCAPRFAGCRFADASQRPFWRAYYAEEFRREADVPPPPARRPHHLGVLSDTEVEVLKLLARLP